MFDDFRQQGDKPVFTDEEETPVKATSKRALRRFRSSRRQFLGMTAPQRFVIAVMLLMMTCVLGTFCLLVTERIMPPFLY